MMLPTRLVLILACLFGPASASEAGMTTSVSSSLVLKVDNREAAARSLIRRAEDQGGYFSSLSDNFVVVRLPNPRIDGFLAFCDSLGYVVSRGYQAADYSSRIADLEVKIKTRRDLLKDYFAMLQQSPAGSVLTVERSISGITEEIESLEADLKGLRQRLDYGEIRVDFQFRERRAPLKSASSLFKWINTLNLSGLRGNFENGR
jgi:hypothetical protein